ncbi:MAG: hypothetical protein KIT72_14445 [Polyangiaceae bacterium]|nr:hypothetical protein [Polyangiaceae bacterium]MCW5791613.1 hypothetical protein [Polyangiaceae bacterium]
MRWAAWVLLGSGVALAARDVGERAQAEQLLEALKSAPPAAKSATTEPVAKSRAALAKATDQRQAGDTAHAELNEGLAYEWAAAATALTRATEREAELAKVERDVSELSTQEARARALLEETTSRRDRAVGQLKQLDAAPSGAAP